MISFRLTVTVLQALQKQDENKLINVSQISSKPYDSHDIIMFTVSKFFFNINYCDTIS